MSKFDKEAMRRAKVRSTINVLNHMRGESNEQKVYDACNINGFWPPWVKTFRKHLEHEDHMGVDMVFVIQLIDGTPHKALIQIKSSKKYADKFKRNDHHSYIQVVVVEDDDKPRDIRRKVKDALIEERKKYLKLENWRKELLTENSDF